MPKKPYSTPRLTKVQKPPVDLGLHRMADALHKLADSFQQLVEIQQQRFDQENTPKQAAREATVGTAEYKRAGSEAEEEEDITAERDPQAFGFVGPRERRLQAQQRERQD